MMRLLLCLVLLALLHSFGNGRSLVQLPLEPFHYTSQPYHDIPFPDCDTCPDDGTLRAPSIGFALETNHGYGKMYRSYPRTELIQQYSTAVIKFHNGTFDNVALIEGDESYKALMRQLVTGPMKRTPDSFDSNWVKFRHTVANALRLANKLVGRPATPETGILASMVSKLVEATSIRLGSQYTGITAVLSTPDRVHMTEKELGDIFYQLEPQSLMAKRWSPYQLYATSAAYAGYNKGLCTTYTDAYACDREEWYMPARKVLHVDLNSETLTGTVETIQSVYGPDAGVSFVDTRLGYKFKDDRDPLTGRLDDGIYWTAVSKRIRQLVKPLIGGWRSPVTQILLSGPFATDRHLHYAIRAALQDLTGLESALSMLDHGSEFPDNERDWQSFFTFATARGAAEIAKRMQEGPVQCAQSDECRWKRERIHGERQSVEPGHSHDDLWDDQVFMMADGIMGPLIQELKALREYWSRVAQNAWSRVVGY